MRYGRHDPERFLEENPRDERVFVLQEDLQKLDAKSWEALPGEAPIDFKHRVEQSYHSLQEEHLSERADRLELMTERRLWAEKERSSIQMNAHEGNTAQRDGNLRLGGGLDVARQLGSFDRAVVEDRHQGLKDFTQDVIYRQAARSEFITNHLVGPALDQKLEELGLDKVQEPERTPPQEPIREPGKGSQLLDDTMEKAAEVRKAREAAAALEAFNLGLEKLRTEERER